MEAPLLIPICASCAEFQAFEREPDAGLCYLHDVQVRAEEQGCSHHYTEVEAAEASTDDEF